MFFSGIADEAGQSIDVQIKAHKELGWNHIEIRNVDSLNLTDVSDRVFHEVCAKLEEAGLQVSCFASQLCNWARPITIHPDVDVNELKRAIPRMQRTNCEFIRVMSYPNAGWAKREWRDEVVERFKTLARIAENGGITLAHENCKGYAGLGPDETTDILEAVDSPSLKLLWDTGNPVGEGQDPWDYYEGVKEHICYVHIKDAVVTENDGETYTFPGEGHGKVRDIVADLLRRGYDGGFSIEPHVQAVVHEGKKAADADAAYEAYVEYGRRLMKLVQEVK